MMIMHAKKIEWIKKSNRNILLSIIKIQEEIKKIHPLNPVEKVKLENAIAIDSIFHSYIVKLLTPLLLPIWTGVVFLNNN